MDLLENHLQNNTILNNHPWESARYSFFVEKIKSKIELNKSVTIFDIGCGDAFFISQIKRDFPNVTCVGIDINFNTSLIENLKKNRSDVFLYQSIDDALKNHPQVDLILLMDVIEHIENDVGFLETVVKPIADQYQSLIYITVPAYQFLFTNHDTFLGHYRRYNNTLLKKNVNISGLLPLETGYFFTSLIALRFLEKIKYKLNPELNAEGLANWNHGSTMTNIVKNVLVWDYKFSTVLRKLGINIPGLSNYMICKGKN